MSQLNRIAPLAVGMSGFNGSKNETDMQPSDLTEALNVTYENGTVQKEGGADKYNSSSLSASILAGHDWQPTSSVQRSVVYLSDGTVKQDNNDGSYATTLASGLSGNEAYGEFVDGGLEVAGNNRKLFLFTGENAVQVLSGTATSMNALSSPPADWATTNQPLVGVQHRNRLWGAGNLNDPHRVYYSLATDHEDFTSAGAGSVSIYPGEGERIVALWSFRGLLIVFKSPNGIYALDTTDADPANWTNIKRINTKIGLLGPGLSAALHDDIAYMDQGLNVRLLSATDAFGDVGSTSLSTAKSIDTWLRDNANVNTTQAWRMVWYEYKAELHISFTHVNGTAPDRRLVMDLNHPQGFPRWRISDRDEVASFWLRDENTIPRLIFADRDGFVWQADRATRNKDGAGYLGQFRTPNLDLSYIDPGLAVVHKTGMALELVVEPLGSWDISVDIIWDGVIVLTRTFNMGITGAVLGSFIIGTDALAQGQLLTRVRRIYGSGRRFGLRVKNSGTDEDFSIARFYLHFLQNDERIPQV